jgi:hypothetical protein
LCIEASLFIQIIIEGGLKDKDVTEVAVMAWRSSFSFAEMTFTVEVIPLIAIKKSS